jgi:ABC-type maltose transport system permease subunit
MLCLRVYRCTTECGWRGLRFSRSQFRRRKRRLKATLFVVLFIVTAAVTVRYVLTHLGSVQSPPGDDGIQESG